MDRFYRRPQLRAAYQKYIDKREAETFDHPFERQVAEYVANQRPVAALEIGCGNGRFYRTLQRAGFSGRYLGTDVADWIVRDCRRRHPEASWIAASAYDLPFAGRSFDVCFSYGVVESFIHPEKALAEMLRILKPGGRLVLLFPDFVESGQLGSQLTGLSPGRATTKLRRRRWLDAALTFYDQRFRLPRALRASRKQVGPFPVNLAPVALDHPSVTLPDYDAVYVSSKADMEEWASARGLAVEFPLGRRLPKTLRARSWAFLVIRGR